MTLKDSLHTVKDESVKAIKETGSMLDPTTTNRFWGDVRNAFALTALLATGVATIPMSLPVSVVAWAAWIAKIAGGIAFTANLDNSKVSSNKVKILNYAEKIFRLGKGSPSK